MEVKINNKIYELHLVNRMGLWHKEQRAFYDRNCEHIDSFDAISVHFTICHILLSNKSNNYMKSHSNKKTDLSTTNHKTESSHTKLIHENSE